MSPLSENERTCLARLESKHGELDAAVVIEAARNPNSPLHHRFEWDEAKAATLYRMVRARGLIREIHIQVQTETVIVEVPAYVSRLRDNGYIAVGKLSEDDQKESMTRELVCIHGDVKRALGLAGLWGLQDVEKKLHSFCRWLATQIK